MNEQERPMAKDVAEVKRLYVAAEKERRGAAIDKAISQREAAKEFFSRNARDGTVIVKHQRDGSMRVQLQPFRTKDFAWHRPERFVPEEQWTAATGISRWEFSRRRTPQHQANLFRVLRDRFHDCPPGLPDATLFASVDESRARGETLPSGLPGGPIDPALLKAMRSLVIEETSPDGQWRFLVQAVRMNEHLVADRLDVRHRDFRTVADWTLLMRFRSWVLEDDRDCFLYLPGQDVGITGWQGRYENATPNNLAMLSPRFETEPSSKEEEPCD